MSFLLFFRWFRCRNFRQHFPWDRLLVLILYWIGSVPTVCTGLWNDELSILIVWKCSVANSSNGSQPKCKIYLYIAICSMLVWLLCPTTTMTKCGRVEEWKYEKERDWRDGTCLPATCLLLAIWARWPDMCKLLDADRWVRCLTRNTHKHNGKRPPHTYIHCGDTIIFTFPMGYTIKCVFGTRCIHSEWIVDIWSICFLLHFHIVDCCYCGW